MGMYTEIFVNVDLKENLPDDVLDTLNAVVVGNTDYMKENNLPLRWAYIFGNGSYYLPLTCVRKLTFDDIGEHYSLLGKGDIKNYGSEIEKFFKFIAPYVKTEFMGYLRYEEDDEPTLVYKSKAGELNG